MAAEHEPIVSHQSTLLQFLQKITQIVLRARLVPKHTTPTLSPVRAFWRGVVPLEIGILCDGHVLEKWQVWFIPIPAELASELDARASELDVTQLMLLVQSLYAHIRWLPLHSAIETMLDRSRLSYVISWDQTLPEFRHSRVKVNNFNRANTSTGVLSISVTYPATQTIHSPFPSKTVAHSPAPRSRGSPVPDAALHSRLVGLAQLKMASDGKRVCGSSPLAERVDSEVAFPDVPAADGAYGVSDERATRQPHASPVVAIKKARAASDHFGPLVGSYEESILSGRMSTLPSLPIQFTATIGVVGNGKVPRHLTVPFEAYYYEMEGHASPFVGTVAVRYRVPPKGRLQLVISNGQNVGVKLFSVPYDLERMPAGCRTFLRRSEWDTGRLAFALHLGFECVRGKLFLGPSLRVVFGGRADERRPTRVETHFL